jgi:hypothetical protein
LHQPRTAVRHRARAGGLESRQGAPECAAAVHAASPGWSGRRSIWWASWTDGPTPPRPPSTNESPRCSRRLGGLRLIAMPTS